MRNPRWSALAKDWKRWLFKGLAGMLLGVGIGGFIEGWIARDLSGGFLANMVSSGVGGAVGGAVVAGWMHWRDCEMVPWRKLIGFWTAGVVGSVVYIVLSGGVGSGSVIAVLIVSSATWPSKESGIVSGSAGLKKP